MSHSSEVAFPPAIIIGRYPITFEDYARFSSSISRRLPNDQGWGRGRQPVINVSWDDAVEYAKWLSEQTGKRYRLPTEAEGEYAARAGTETDYWWGNEMKPGMANCKDGDSRWGGRQTSPVGSFDPNPFGLYDTAGNVWQWVQDAWHENYQDAPDNGAVWEISWTATISQCVRSMLDDPSEPSSWDFCPHVVRGSNFASRLPRVSTRFRFNAGQRSSDVSFRLAQDLD